MLASLSIRNVVLIDKLDLTFENGLGVFTGETGAGKSILLDSLSLILGARADSSLVRHGENQLSVSAEFTKLPPKVLSLLDEQDIEIEDDTILIRRTITKEGKSKSFINDEPVSVSFLKSIGECLVEIHGQFSTHGLLNPSNHLSVLDSFGNLHSDVLKTKELWQTYKNACNETKKIREKLETANQQKEYLEQSINDLEAINPQKDEESTLVQKRTNLMNSEKILACTDTAFQLLNDEQKGVIHQLSQISRQIEKASQYNESAFQDILNNIYQAQELLTDAEGQLEQTTEQWSDISELPAIDDRLFSLRAMARRYKTTIDELPDLIENFKKELSSIEHADTLLDKLIQKEKEDLQAYMEQAQKLSKKRIQTAQKLDERVKEELPDLKLEKAKFKTSVTQKEFSLASDTGLDEILFTVSTNTGTPLAPLNKIASGGELSRFMLALKVNLAKETALPTLIFDEIDSGVGGATADAIGNRLKRLATDCQVLTVTHAPQVAAYGLQHWTVSKTEKQGKVITNVNKLSDTERLNEIARMLSGSTITKTAEIMAKELLEKQQI